VERAAQAAILQPAEGEVGAAMPGAVVAREGMELKL